MLFSFLDQKYKRYGNILNSYDALKFIAITTMVIDHLGFFIFQETQIYRCIGRMAFPCFLFLVGYSGKWKNSWDIILAAIFIIGLRFYFVFPVFALNILVTIIVVRLLMGLLEKKGYLKNPLIIFIISIIWFLPAGLLFEYGSLALLIAYAGYCVRLEGPSKKNIVLVSIILILHSLITQNNFKFIEPVMHLFFLEMMILGIIFLNFRMMTFDKIAKIGILNNTLRFIGRHSLLIYVVHLAILMFINYHLYPGSHLKFRWL